MRELKIIIKKTPPLLAAVAQHHCQRDLASFFFSFFWFPPHAEKCRSPKSARRGIACCTIFYSSFSKSSTWLRTSASANFKTERRNVPDAGQTACGSTKQPSANKRVRPTDTAVRVQARWKAACTFVSRGDERRAERTRSLDFFPAPVYSELIERL